MTETTAYGTGSFFLHDVKKEGIIWMSKAAGLIAIVATGWIVNQLLLVTLAVIAVFVLVEGIRPYFNFATRIVSDAIKCAEEKKHLQDVPIENAEMITNLDTSDCGSVMLLAVGIFTCENRLDRQKAADLFLYAAEQQWQAMLSPVRIAADNSIVLGLGASLLGILSAVTTLSGALSGGTAEAMLPAFSLVMSAMATMVVSSIAGCVGALVLVGLAAKGEEALDQHMAELRVIAALLVGDEDDDEEQFLLGGVPK